MPVNGQMNLMDVVAAGQQAQQWAQQNEQYARQRKAQQSADEANQAAAGILDGSRKEWLSTGAQGQYKPSDETMMRMAEARGLSFAERGDWENFMKNEAAVTSQRARVRANALQRFMTDGDAEALVKAHHATVFDGRRITGMEKLENVDAVQGLPARKGGILVKFSDGKEQLVDPMQLANGIKASLIDPAKTAEMEAEFNMKASLERLKGKEKRDEIAAKGEEDRATEGVKTDRAIQVEGVKFGHAKTLNEATHASREKATGISAGATRYSADQRVAAAKIGADKKAGDPEAKARKSFKELHTEVIRTYGPQSSALGGGRMGDENTMAIARYAEALIENEDASPSDAIARSIAEFKKRKATK